MSENLIQGKIAAVERPERPELTDEEEEQADKEYLEDMKTY